MSVSAALLVSLLLAAPAVGAQSEDEQTRDYERQDRRYRERYEKPEPAPADPGDPQDDGAAYYALLDELLRDKHYRSDESAHYLVETDDPRLDPQAASGLLESFRRFFDRFWESRADLVALDETSRVCLFYSFHDYNRLLAGDFRFTPLRPKGHYGSLYDVVTLHTDGGVPAELPDTLIHEAAHQLLDRRLHPGEHPIPIWVAEGLASYFGFTLRDAQGEFHEGQVGGKSIDLLGDGKPPRPTEPAKLLKRVKQSLRDPQLDSGTVVADLLWIREPNDFYGRDPDLHYGTSWLLVHTLFHADEQRHAPGFTRWLGRLARGGTRHRSLLQELGVEAPELEAALTQHLRTIKIR